VFLLADCPAATPSASSPLQQAAAPYPHLSWSARIMFPGPMQLLVVLFIILLLFGGAKVPSLMRNLGRGANEFKRGLSENEDDDKATLEDKTA
jgi:sec-independent protein translocase protein TatA